MVPVTSNDYFGIWNNSIFADIITLTVNREYDTNSTYIDITLTGMGVMFFHATYSIGQTAQVLLHTEVDIYIYI
jgi:hypothetical protein